MAHGLTPERLREQLEIVERLNVELAPFRILTGIEVDILDDGSLDQDDDLLAELDVVVASVHSKLRMGEQPMTDRMVAAMANPNTDILGHCTGRLVIGEGGRVDVRRGAGVRQRARTSTRRSRSTAGPNASTRRCACSRSSSAPAARCRSTATPHAVGQLEWQPYGCTRAAEAGVDTERIVNTWPVDRLLEWTASHA